ncbi:MAG: ComEC/Rec2 family competence protein, partial [Patescibacteria group bacterium]
MSGYNVMIVAEAVLKTARRLPKHIAASIAGVAILLFVLAAGGGASAVRAGLMAGVALFARATGRTYDALRALIAIFVLMLLLNPALLVSDTGFQFSFVAALGLILGTPLVEPRLMFIHNALLREVVATTIAAQVFVLPLLLYQTGNLSLVALPANILVLPTVPLAMLLSAIAGFVALLVPVAATIVGAPAFVVLWYITSMASWPAALPLAQVIIPQFS